MEDNNAQQKKRHGADHSFRCTIRLHALIRQPPTALSTFLDEHYPDERMRRIYPNAVHTD